MPANKKHLSSNGQRFAKVSSAILGGFLLTMALHLALAAWLGRVNVIITATFSGFIVWAGLMVVAFLAKNGWKLWLVYLLLTALLLALFYFGK